MKSYHLLVAVIIAFVVGALYPAPVTFVRSKLGV